MSFIQSYISPITTTKTNMKMKRAIMLVTMTLGSTFTMSLTGKKLHQGIVTSIHLLSKLTLFTLVGLLSNLAVLINS